MGVDLDPAVIAAGLQLFQLCARRQANWVRGQARLKATLSAGQDGQQHKQKQQDNHKHDGSNDHHLPPQTQPHRLHWFYTLLLSTGRGGSAEGLG